MKARGEVCTVAEGLEPSAQAASGAPSSGRWRGGPALRSTAPPLWLWRSGGGASLVVPVEAAGFLDLHDFPVLWCLYGPRLWAVHGERAVAGPAMVMLEVVAEEAQQVPLVEDDDVVQETVLNLG